MAKLPQAGDLLGIADERVVGRLEEEGQIAQGRMTRHRVERLEADKALPYRGMAVLVGAKRVHRVVEVDGTQTVQAHHAVKLIEQQLRQKGAAAYPDTKERGASDKKDKLETLSEREKDIIACVTKGMSNKEIARALFLSVHTVTTHRRNISNKLQIHTPAGLTIYAIANKLVNIEDLQL